MGGKLAQEKVRFAVDFGVWFQEYGYSPTAGRVLGWLMVCDPPHQTAREIAEAVGASLGAISSTARELMRAGFVERCSLPGKRATLIELVTRSTPESYHARQRELALADELPTASVQSAGGQR